MEDHTDNLFFPSTGHSEEKGRRIEYRREGYTVQSPSLVFHHLVLWLTATLSFLLYKIGMPSHSPELPGEKQVTVAKMVEKKNIIPMDLAISIRGIHSNYPNLCVIIPNLSQMTLATNTCVCMYTHTHVYTYMYKRAPNNRLSHNHRCAWVSASQISPRGHSLLRSAFYHCTYSSLHFFGPLPSQVKRSEENKVLAQHFSLCEDRASTIRITSIGAFFKPIM